MAFAIANGNFSSGSTWDTGVVPTGGEDAYANSFTIQVDGTQSLGRIRNDATTFLLPGMPIPVMTSNTTPSGTAFASTASIGGEAWRAFDQSTSSIWGTPTGTLTGSIGYQFPTAKIIKRYLWRSFTSAGNNPRNWTFEGSVSGVTWVVLDTVTGSSIGASATYISSGLTNTNAYSFYRMNITLNNGGTNTLQVAELEMTELTGTVNGGVAGGTFNLLNGSNLTCTADTGVVVGSVTAPLNFGLNSPNSSTFNGSVLTVNNVANFIVISLSGTGTLNAIGNYNIDGTVNTKRIFSVTSTGTLNVTGACTSTVSINFPNNVIFSNAASTINLTGPITGGATLSNFATPIYSIGGSIINVRGNILAGVNAAITSIAGTINVTGNTSGSSTSAAIQNITTITPININGSVTAGNGSPAIIGLGEVTLTGPLINTNGYMAVNAPSLFITSATTYWSFTSSGGSPRILYTDAPTNVSGFPSTTDVRIGTVYGPTNTSIGTMNVPLPSDVRINVPTDNTVGTATLTAEDLFDAISGSTSGVGLRLKNVATVATVGKQIASYNI